MWAADTVEMFSPFSGLLPTYGFFGLNVSIIVIVIIILSVSQPPFANAVGLSMMITARVGVPHNDFGRN